MNSIEYHIRCFDNIDSNMRMSIMLILRTSAGRNKLFCHDPLFLEESVKTWNGAFISSLHEFHPENDQTGMRIASVHIPDGLISSGVCWFGWEWGRPRAATQRVPGAVIAV